MALQYRRKENRDLGSVTPNTDLKASAGEALGLAVPPALFARADEVLE